MFVDGAFKCCPKFFIQLYTVHGMRNGPYIPLVYALLNGKSEDKYRSFWNDLLTICTERNLQLKPSIIHVDFEQAMHNVLKKFFRMHSLNVAAFI